MAYEVCQTCLLLPIDLTRSECASWVQAIGSVFAIGAAIFAAIFQANRQQAITRQAMLDQANQATLSTASALKELAKSASKFQLHIKSILSTRDAVYEAGVNGIPFAMAMLSGLERSLNAIEVHKLPATLVRFGLILPASITQLRMKVEMTLKHHQQMDADAFDDFFQTLDEMTDSLQKSIVELVEVRQISPKT
jgi:phage-related tail protein